MQQTLLRDDQTIKNLKANDPLDLAQKAKASASGVHETALAENVLNGFTRDMPEKFGNRWVGPMSKDGAWLELTWDKPQTISHVQMILDSGMTRGELTLSSNDGMSKGHTYAPQPELLKDFTILGKKSGGENFEPLIEVKDNIQRLVRCDFASTKLDAIRILVQSTNGDKLARIYEVRAYA
ncbi:MAG: hypothetical protein QM811_09740 [Pirellulales bacterium]